MRWTFSASRYKSRVLALPPARDGNLRHIEWDGWGFPGAGNTVAYLVFDPSNQLAGVAPKHVATRLPGLPCDVNDVRRLDSGWYSVLFYTGTDWEHCA